MSPRRLLLAISTALALWACGEGRKLPGVNDPELLASAFDGLRVDRAQQLRPDPVNVDPVLLWPDLPPREAADRRDVSFNAVLRGLAGRSFVFSSRRPGWAEKHSLYWLEVGAGKPTTPFVEESGPSMGRENLGFGVEPVPEGFLVIYPNGTRVVQVRASLAEEGLVFSPRRTIFAGASPVMNLQLTRTDDRLHLIWTTHQSTYRCSLYHFSAVTGDLEWSEPHLLTRTTSFGNACMAASDRDVYVAWCDSRYSKWRWDRTINAGKVFLAASRDGGKTFSTPVSLHEGADRGDNAEAVDIVVGRGGLAVFMRLDARGPDLRSFVWDRAAVDFDLQRVARGTYVYGQGIQLGTLGGHR